MADKMGWMTPPTLRTPQRDAGDAAAGPRRSPIFQRLDVLVILVAVSGILMPLWVDDTPLYPPWVGVILGTIILADQVRAWKDRRRTRPPGTGHSPNQDSDHRS